MADEISDQTLASSFHTLLEWVLAQHAQLQGHLLVDLTQIKADLASIKAQGILIMENFQAVITKVDTATNLIRDGLTAVEAKLDALKAQIADMGLTGEQEKTILAGLEGATAGLEVEAARAASLGANPADPVPAAALKASPKR